MVKIISGFSRAKSELAILSTIIQLTEDRKFSHAYIRYIDPTTKVEMISQASHGYVNECSLEQFLKHNIIVEEYEIEVADDKFVEMLIHMKTEQGVKYGFGQLMYISVNKLIHYKVKTDNGNKEYICSEWVAKNLSIAGLQMPTLLDLLTPSDLQSILTQLKYKNRLYIS